jgi:hypothetical protein
MVRARARHDLHHRLRRGQVPSTGEDDPYMHIFLDCGGGNVLAFFELPSQPEMGRDENTPPGCSISRSRCRITKR